MGRPMLDDMHQKTSAGPPRPPRRAARGMTLIEVLVALYRNLTKL